MSDKSSSPGLTEADAETAVPRLAAVVGGLAERFGGPPTLGELLELLGWSLPTAGDALAEAVALPQRFRANVRGGRRYEPPAGSRVPELADAEFAEAGTLSLFLAERVGARTGRPVTVAELTAALATVLGSAVASGAVTLADVEKGEPVRLAPLSPPKRVPKPRVGDVVAIPTPEGGHHRLAVILARDRFGTALGVLRGTFTLPRIGGGRPPEFHPRAVYTEEQSIASGAWRVVDHDPSLAARFPREPEIYHRADTLPPGTVDSAYGAAETAAGALRPVDRDEAEAVGLLDGSYRQTYLSADVPGLLERGGFSF
ncbi:hypothetical protein SAMN06297387_1142 [Streptomyces zhaozhouensis]|uniref:Immunity protein 26 n=1 Tax=Streptomyces zhaozhouensis TaxID=1300267 RepID=A0A286DZH7_9ACTN|nr:hypothetical protein [Streptomyces zhaozhouensis]SOD64023.1 hypothetical protein SAMN06297387_1142 [Streptomyces zhaozhouensis]